MWPEGFLSLDSIQLAVTAFFLLLFYAVKIDSSSTASLFIWVVHDVSCQLLNGTVMGLAQSYPDVGYGIWYGSWSIAAAASIYSIYHVHLKWKLVPTRLSLFLSVSLVTVIFLQCFGFYLRAVLHERSLDWVYQYGIITIYVAVVPFVIFEFYSKYFKNILKTRELF